MATTDKKPERTPSDRSVGANLERMREQGRQARSKYILSGDEERAEKVLALIRGCDELLAKKEGQP